MMVTFEIPSAVILLIMTSLYASLAARFLSETTGNPRIAMASEGSAFAASKLSSIRFVGAH